MTLAELYQLDLIGHSSRKWRRYWWAEHFIALGDLRAAKHFVGLLYKQDDWVMPRTWGELATAVEPGRTT